MDLSSGNVHDLGRNPVHTSLTVPGPTDLVPYFYPSTPCPRLTCVLDPGPWGVEVPVSLTSWSRFTRVCTPGPVSWENRVPSWRRVGLTKQHLPKKFTAFSLLFWTFFQLYHRTTIFFFGKSLFILFTVHNHFYTSLSLGDVRLPPLHLTTSTMSFIIILRSFFNCNLDDILGR